MLAFYFSSSLFSLIFFPSSFSIYPLFFSFFPLSFSNFYSLISLFFTNFLFLLHIFLFPSYLPLFSCYLIILHLFSFSFILFPILFFLSLLLISFCCLQLTSCLQVCNLYIPAFHTGCMWRQTSCPVLSSAVASSPWWVATKVSLNLHLPHPPYSPIHASPSLHSRAILAVICMLGTVWRSSRQQRQSMDLGANTEVGEKTGRRARTDFAIAGNLSGSI